MKYTKEFLCRLDEKMEMIPLYFDQMFKSVMMKNSEVFKRFLIDTLRLNIDYDKSEINFLNNEFPKEISKERGKVIDIHVRIDNKFTIDCEMNYYYDEEVMAKSSVYMDKFRGSFIEVNEAYKDIFDYDFYQLNLNKSSKMYPNGENVIVSYNLTTDAIFPDHKKVVLKNLDYYSSLYYNMGRNLSFDQLFMVALLSKNFTELDSVLSRILNDEERDRFLESVINMSNDSFSLHAWQKEKLDKWEKWHRDKRLDEKENKLDEKENALDEKENKLDEKENALDEKENKLDEKKNALDEKENKLDEKKNALDEKEILLNEKENQINEKESQINEKESQINEKESQINEKEVKLKQEKIDVVKRLIEKKLSFDEISYIVGISVNDIRTIVKKNKL